MPNPAAIIASQVIGVVITRFISFLFSGPPLPVAALQQNLEQFLNTLSRDFANKVEEVVRNSFFENNFDHIKANILTANATLVRFQSTKTVTMPLGDQQVLNLAKHDVDYAYSLLLTQIQRILVAADRPPRNTPTSLKSYLTMIEIALSALQACALIDLSVSTEYADHFPNYKQNILQRLDEYIQYSNQLVELFKRHQSLRVVKKEKRLYWTDGFEQHYNQFASVFPSKDSIKANLTLWVFEIDGVTEISGVPSCMPTSYAGFSVSYNCNHENANLRLSESSQYARNEPNKIIKHLTQALAIRAVPPRQQSVNSAVALWNEAKEVLNYSIAYNYLVDLIENNLSLSMQQLTDARGYFEALTVKDKNILLCRSVRLAQTPLITLFTELHGDLNIRDDDTPAREGLLHIAVRTGESSAVSGILSHIPDLTTFCRQSVDPVVLALSLNFPEIARIIEKEKLLQVIRLANNPQTSGREILSKFNSIKSDLIDINEQELSTGNTLLHTLVPRMEKQEIEYILQLGTDPFIANRQQQTILQLTQAVPNNQYANFIQEIFLHAANKGNVALLQKCLNHAVNVNYQDPRSRQSALHKVVRSACSQADKAAVINLLVANHINIFLLDSNNKLASEYDDPSVKLIRPYLGKELISALQMGSVPCYRNLPIDELVNYRDAQGNSILHIAINSAAPEPEVRNFVRCVCYGGVQQSCNATLFFARNHQDESAKDLALRLNKPLLVAELEEHHRRALFQGVIYYHEQNIRGYVRDHGNINAPISGDETALQLAIGHLYHSSQQIDNIRLLISLGADVNVRDRNGISLLDQVRHEIKTTGLFFKPYHPQFVIAFKLLTAAHPQLGITEQMADNYLLAKHHLASTSYKFKFALLAKLLLHFCFHDSRMNQLLTIENFILLIFLYQLASYFLQYLPVGSNYISGPKPSQR